MAVNRALNFNTNYFPFHVKTFPRKNVTICRYTWLGLPHCFPIFGKEQDLEDGQLAIRGQAKVVGYRE